MIYEFDEFSVDTERFSLSRAGVETKIEPKALTLLILLIENRHRMVPRDELVSAVWPGRVVSEAAVATAIRSLRKSLGDSGASQSVIRTVHGKGLRFVAPIDGAQSANPPLSPGADSPVADHEQDDTRGGETGDHRPTVAVLPFYSTDILLAPLGEGLAHDLITALCRLRWLFVIARGSSFRFVSHQHDVRDVGRALNIRYCLSGSVSRTGNEVIVDVELADTRSGRLCWQHRYVEPRENIHEVRQNLVDSLVSTLDIQIPMHEASLAALRVPDDLDAWSHYHLGVRHMFRFKARDNAVAAEHFRVAVSRSPEFARAHAGLSFTSFQDAFLKYVPDLEEARRLARGFAEEALALDPQDPFTNLCMGRALWLESELPSSRDWVERATRLSPNYAQAVYAHAWTETLRGNGDTGARSSELAMTLSPLDPLFYAMLGTRSLACMVNGDYAKASQWAERAVRSPGAHALIDIIAIAAHALNDDGDRARRMADRFHARRSGIGRTDFFRSFPFADETLRRRLDAALKRHGL